MTSYVTANPSTGNIEKEFPELTDDQVDPILERSAKAYQEWRNTPIEQRVQMLRDTAQAYRDRAAELGEVVSREMGKPLPQAAGELALTAMIYDWYADNGPALLERKVLDPMGADESTVVSAPVGPLLGIMPWNFPYYQVARFAAPNLLLGNTIVLKHAPICAESSALMEEIAHGAGVPEDAYINVYATNDQAATMIADPRIQGVSLTGSSRAGAAVAEVAARNLKKSVLELGGSDAFIVLDSDDAKAAGAAAASMRLMNAGQACNSPKRFIVKEELYDDFVSGLVEAVENVKVGDPTEDGTFVGPLSSVAARDQVVKQVQEAVAQGATLHTGGTAVDGPGAFMAPGVITGVTKDMSLYGEELFGPVAVVYSVSDDEEAVQLANDVQYGLTGSVWSSDLDRATQIADRLDVGNVMINEHGTSLPGLPFGGVKASGYGRELGQWGLGEFANVRLRRVTGAK